jgi:hypothetical protein
VVDGGRVVDRSSSRFERGTPIRQKTQMFPSIESVIRSPKNSLSRARSSTDSNMNNFSPPDFVLIPTNRTKIGLQDTAPDLLLIPVSMTDRPAKYCIESNSK